MDFEHIEHKKKLEKNKALESEEKRTEAIYKAEKVGTIKQRELELEQRITGYKMHQEEEKAGYGEKKTKNNIAEQLVHNASQLRPGDFGKV